MRAESGGAQHGMTFDDWGRRFVCSNSDHIQMVMFEDRYVARNPLFAGPVGAARASRPMAARRPVFRISPVEAWRIVRTRMRIANPALGAVEGGGRAAGYFTGATGVTCYRGDAFPGRNAQPGVRRRRGKQSGPSQSARRTTASRCSPSGSTKGASSSRPTISGSGRHSLPTLPTARSTSSMFIAR